jgi:hypothetical protein
MCAENQSAPWPSTIAQQSLAIRGRGSCSGTPESSGPGRTDCGHLIAQWAWYYARKQRVRAREPVRLLKVSLEPWLDRSAEEILLSPERRRKNRRRQDEVPREHVIPLSDLAISLIKELIALNIDPATNDHLLPTHRRLRRGNKPIEDKALARSISRHIVEHPNGRSALFGLTPLTLQICVGHVRLASPVSA